MQLKVTGWQLCGPQPWRQHHPEPLRGPLGSSLAGAEGGLSIHPPRAPAQHKDVCSMGLVLCSVWLLGPPQPLLYPVPALGNMECKI